MTARLKTKRVPIGAVASAGTAVIEQPVKVTTWNGYTPGSVVRVNGFPRSSRVTFIAYCVSPTGIEYVEVLEQQSAGHLSQGPRLTRSVAPGRIIAPAKRRASK